MDGLSAFWNCSTMRTPALDNLAPLSSAILMASFSPFCNPSVDAPISRNARPITATLFLHLSFYVSQRNIHGFLIVRIKCRPYHWPCRLAFASVLIPIHVKCHPLFISNEVTYACINITLEVGRRTLPFVDDDVLFRLTRRMIFRMRCRFIFFVRRKEVFPSNSRCRFDWRNEYLSGCSDRFREYFGLLDIRNDLFQFVYEVCDI